MQNLIFGTDGIRGIANKQMSASLIFFVGKSLAIRLLENTQSYRKVMVGRDNRQSSDMLFCALSAGLMSMGVDVVDVGLVTTPALSYLLKDGGCDYGVMITASHNPAEYNGIKIFDSFGHKIMPEQEQKIVDIYNNMDSYIYSGDVGRMYDNKDKIYKYIDKIIDSIGNLSLKDRKIAIDCANGAGSDILPYVFKTLIDKCDCYNCKTLGEINKDCGSVNTQEFCKIVKNNYDYGFAFDGDADRIVVILKDGQILSGEKILYILAKYYHSQNRLTNNTVITTILTSICVEQALQKLGIKTIRCDVGDKYVFNAMQQHNAVLGGEDSGHVLLGDINPTADAMLVGLTLLKIFAEIDFDIQGYIQDIQPYYSLKDDILVSERQKKQFLLGVLNDFVSSLDNEMGEDGRLLVRASGTECVIRVLLEGKDKDLMQNIAKKVKQKILDL
ncbi:MAG: hypothetical protein IJU58_00210 [Clostridia bacterium]|nr:hypothetical protein [Clostridia bacterium]